MQFNSVEFGVFFPLVLVVYFLIPRKIRSIWLLIASYYFYMSWKDTMPYKYPARIENKLTNMFAAITSKLTINPVIFILAWRTGIYTLFLLGDIVYALLKGRGLSLIVFIPAIFNVFALYAASGWSDYRYYWPIAVMTIFIFPFMNIYLREE
ncbi:hypothetical protein NXH64_04845 [Butyrivibrio fibrisolvens]|uniref:hypothetical protein n=1 Tax=Pseudobutyrivibrio ruminis TaxID=46206 RepID=UPI0004832297|nr:hypothetical protein [Pseudobutyrivibrio ruminis]MDC7278827.1 hypothetical protein [Butyrivibrio fibrisolvens]